MPKTNVNPYNTYITKIYRTIPKESALIIRNKFNGQDVKVKTSGFALITPWKESKLVSLAVRNFDYPKDKFEDMYGQDVIVDLSVTVKVTDPIKYEYSNQSIEQELSQLISSSMRVLINKNNFTNLKSKRFNISNYNCSGDNYYKNVHIDKDGKLIGTKILASNYDLTKEEDRTELEFTKELCEFRRRLDNFAFRYGLSVVDLYNKEVQQTEDIQHAYNKQIIAKKEAEAKMIEKQAELERARVDAEIMEINSKAKANADKVKYEAILNVLKNSDMTTEEQAKFLQAFMYSSGKENVAGAAAAAVAGATAGVTSSVMNEEVKKVK